jgi:AcrR family transcriptional regulator
MAADQPWVRELLPEGLDHPSDVPAEIFSAALATFLRLERLDMSTLAIETGIGRTTLYRRVGDRDLLLGAVLWYVTRQTLVDALVATAELSGIQRITETTAFYLREIYPQPPFRRLLDAEPEIALRILTSRAGPVQHGLVDFHLRLLEHEVGRGNLRLIPQPSALAYTIVRISESYMYADVIAGRSPDVEEAVAVIGMLLRGSVERRRAPRAG